MTWGSRWIVSECSVTPLCGLFVTPWTVAHEAPLSMGFPRQDYWSRLPFPTTGDLPDPGIEPASPALAGGFFTAEPLWKPQQGLACTVAQTPGLEGTRNTFHQEERRGSEAQLSSSQAPPLRLCWGPGPPGRFALAWKAQPGSLVFIPGKTWQGQL